MEGLTPEAFHPLARLREQAAARADAGLRRSLVARQRTPSGSPLLDLASNDYLGLAGDPRLAEAAARAARAWGTGATGSRLVTGTTALHEELEAELADFTGAASALVFSSGYLANLTAVTALAAALAGPRGVLIVADAGNHASLIDGCRLAKADGARLQVAPHGDLAAMERALRYRAEQAAIVITDAVFSVAGDLAPVAQLHALARAHGAILLVDEAHSFGVLGTGGRGICHGTGLAAQPDLVRTVTLSKALSGQGGAVLGAAEVRQTLVDTGRGFIFDTGLAPSAAAVALAALGILRECPDLPERARRNTKRLAAIAADLGLAASTPDAAVASVILGAPRAAVDAQRICGEHGVSVGCFRPPSVPVGQACLRLTGRATLSEIDLATASRALAVVRDHSRIPENIGGRAQ